MLQAIFYARFHTERGPSIIHQYPQASIIAPGSAANLTLLDFSNIVSCIIPSYEVCNRPLSVCANGHRVLGFAVSLEDSKYERNRFTYNVCFVLDEQVDARPWEQIVRKTASFFRELEEESGMLQAEEELDGLKWAGEEAYPAEDVGVIHPLLESVMEDLNAYGETCARVNEFHVLNLRLMATKATPPKVRAWHVPLLLRPLPTGDEWTWDLTLKRIHSHIDGTKHIQRIAELADVELKLAKKAVRELLHHERVTLLDLFHFQAIYTLTPDFAWFVKDESFQEECTKYIAVDPTTKDIFRSTAKSDPPSPQAIISLYRDLNPGISLHDFCLGHEPILSHIDIRRFITFGVLKGFLRRVHKYALAVDSHSMRSRSTSSGSPTRGDDGDDAEKEWDRAWKRAAFSSGWTTPPAERPTAIVGEKKAEVAAEEDWDQDEGLRALLDGRHCMDEICVSCMRMSERGVVEKLRSGRFGEVVIFCK